MSISGTEILTYNLSKELSKTHEVHVLYPIVKKGITHCHVNSFQDATAKIEIHELILESDLRSHIAGLLKFDLLSLSNGNRKIQNQFEELLNKVKPDVVTFQHLMGSSVALPQLAKKCSRVVLVLNDYWLICPTTHFLNSNGKICKGFTARNCWICLSEEWSTSIQKLLRDIINKITGNNLEGPLKISTYALKKICESYGVKKITNRAATIRRTIRCADKIIAPSGFIINKFIENGFLNNKQQKDGQIAILSHGVDTANLKTVVKTSSNCIRFGYIGRAFERKGLHILIDAFEKLKIKDAELQIYCSTLNLLIDYQKSIFEKTRNNPKIKIFGRFKNTSDPYHDIDVLVIPSIAYEGYGLVVQEAFACKTPVIASDIGALNEFVKHMVNGLLFQVGNINDLYKKMLFIIQNPQILKYFKSNIPDVKSIEQNTKEIEKLFEETLSKNK